MHEPLIASPELEAQAEAVLMQVDDVNRTLSRLRQAGSQRFGARVFIDPEKEKLAHEIAVRMGLVPCPRL